MLDCIGLCDFPAVFLTCPDLIRLLGIHHCGGTGFIQYPGDDLPGVKGQLVLHPVRLFWVPDACQFFFADQHIHVAIIVGIQNSHGIITAIGAAESTPLQEVFVEALYAFLEVQELDLFAVGFLRVVHQFD